MAAGSVDEVVRFSSRAAALEGNLTMPKGARAIVLFAHGSGSSRHSPRNRYVASVLNAAGIATFLFDLLTEEEEREDVATACYRFDIPLLAQRVLGATEFIAQYNPTRDLLIGYFGASTGAAAALAASVCRDDVAAVVSRGGRPDMAAEALPMVKAPTRLIVGGDDHHVLRLNEDAARLMRTECELVIVPGASHLFEEPGALERVAELAADWFERHLRRR